jgi:ribosome-associated translation inhibitor RaiA
MRTPNRRPGPTSAPTVKIVGLALTPMLKARVTRQLRRALMAVQTRPVHGRVRLADVNGPKGGLDIRCAIDVTIPRMKPFHAEEMAADAVTAFDQALAAITRQIARRLSRREDSDRHPKKYYAARRLLS